MRLASLLLTLLLLAGCSSLKDAADQLFSPTGEDNDCSLNSNPICIPIGGHSGTAKA